MYGITDYWPSSTGVLSDGGMEGSRFNIQPEPESTVEEPRSEETSAAPPSNPDSDGATTDAVDSEIPAPPSEGVDTENPSEMVVPAPEENIPAEETTPPVEISEETVEPEPEPPPIPEPEPPPELVPSSVETTSADTS